MKPSYRIKFKKEGTTWDRLPLLVVSVKSPDKMKSNLTGLGDDFVVVQRTDGASVYLNKRFISDIEPINTPDR